MNKDWGGVEEIYLNDNQFEDEGCEHLAKARWPLLKIISLCND